MTHETEGPETGMFIDDRAFFYLAGMVFGAVRCIYVYRVLLEASGILIPDSLTEQMDAGGITGHFRKGFENVKDALAQPNEPGQDCQPPEWLKAVIDGGKGPE